MTSFDTLFDFTYIKNNYAIIARAIQVINFIICMGLIIFLAASKDIMLFLGNTNVKTGWVIFSIIITILVLLIVTPLLRVVNNNIYALIVSSIILCLSSYVLLDILQWYFTNTEGNSDTQECTFPAVLVNKGT